MYLQKFESPNYSHLLSHEGKANPIHATSTGQVILAYRCQSEIEKVIASGLAPLRVIQLRIHSNLWNF